MVKVQSLVVGTTYQLYLKNRKTWLAEWNGKCFENEGVRIAVDEVDFLAGPVEMRTHTFVVCGQETSVDCLSVLIDGQWHQIADSTNA